MGEEKTFTQAEVNGIVQDRLSRFRQSQKKQAEGQEEQTKLGEGEPDYKQTYIDLLKQTKLVEAGVKMESVDDVKFLIRGDSPEEIDQAIADYMPMMNAKYLRKGFRKDEGKSYADPTGGNKPRGVWNPFS